MHLPPRLEGSLVPGVAGPLPGVTAVCLRGLVGGRAGFQCVLPSCCLAAGLEVGISLSPSIVTEFSQPPL